MAIIENHKTGKHVYESDLIDMYNMDDRSGLADALAEFTDNPFPTAYTEIEKCYNLTGNKRIECAIMKLFWSYNGEKSGNDTIFAHNSNQKGDHLQTIKTMLANINEQIETLINQKKALMTVLERQS